MKQILATALLSMLAAGAAAQGVATVTSVEVFANSATHVRAQQNTPYALRVFRLDAMAQISQQMSIRLPMDEAQAKAYMLQQEANIRGRRTLKTILTMEGSTGTSIPKLERMTFNTF